MSAVAKPASVTGEETLGAKATRLAQEKAKIWLDSTFQVPTLPRRVSCAATR